MSKEGIVNELDEFLIKHSEPTAENALAVNLELQYRHGILQEQLKELQRVVHKKQIENKQILSKRYARTGHSQSGAVLRGASFSFNGNLYFRDGRGRCCPNTADYNQRRSDGEMFPMDYNLRARHIWTLRDKSCVIKAVKAQLVEHLTVFKAHKCKKRRTIAVESVKLTNLLAMLEEEDDNNDDFEIDWNQISVIDLEHRHAPTSIEAMWHVYLKPSLKRSEWSKEEDNRLIKAVQENNYQNWTQIAEQLDKRSDYQCFVRYQSTLVQYAEKRRKKWTKQDDERLLELVSRHSDDNGSVNWTYILPLFPDQPKSTLYNRYYYTLDKRISHERFTPEEDILLIAAFKEHNGKFFCFPRSLFPNRSVRQLRARYYNTLEARAKISEWTIEDDQKLLQYVKENGLSSWQKCADLLGNHTRMSCRTRYITIQRYVTKNPDATIEDIPRKRTRASRNGINVNNWTEKLTELSNNDFAVDPPKEVKPSPVKEDVKVIRKQAPYLKRMRPLQKHIYQYLKYGYGVRFIEPELQIFGTNTDYTFRILASALCFSNMNCNEPFIEDELLPIQIRFRYAVMIQQLPVEIALTPFYKLPISWNSLTGFRAVCIQVSESECDTDSAVAAISDNMETHQHADALLTFRARLRALFYKTILLSRMEPDDVFGLEDELTSMTYTPPEQGESLFTSEFDELTNVKVYESVYRNGALEEM